MSSPQSWAQLSQSLGSSVVRCFASKSLRAMCTQIQIGNAYFLQRMAWGWRCIQYPICHLQQKMSFWKFSKWHWHWILALHTFLTFVSITSFTTFLRRAQTRDFWKSSHSPRRQMQFRQCTFQNAIHNGNFVNANVANLCCSSVLQDQSDPAANHILYVQNAAEGVQDRCCYSEVTSWNITFRPIVLYPRL